MPEMTLSSSWFPYIATISISITAIIINLYSLYHLRQDVFGGDSREDIFRDSMPDEDVYASPPVLTVGTVMSVLVSLSCAISLIETILSHNAGTFRRHWLCGICLACAMFFISCIFHGVRPLELFVLFQISFLAGALMSFASSFALTPRGLSDSPQQLANSFENEYEVSFLRPLISFLLDSPKRLVEYIVGSPLSWWPLSEPEKEPRAGTTRVYSVYQGTVRFYDDISSSLAEQLFPKLSSPLPALLRMGWRHAKRRVVYLKNKPVAELVLHYIDSMCSNEAGEPGSSEDIPLPQLEHPVESPNEPEGRNVMAHRRLRSSNENDRSPEDPSRDVGEYSQDEQKDDSPNTVFLCLSHRPPLSIARSINLKGTDKDVIKDLTTAYKQMLKSCWWRKVTGIRFYRFHSFLYNGLKSRYHIHIHKDEERYPQSEDEVNKYDFSPRPWPEYLPYPGSEMLYLFQNEEACGTASRLKDQLPKRRNANISSDVPEFGIYLEQLLSFWVISLPWLLLAAISIGATLWFIPWWLNRHPNDLTNAIVPVTLVINLGTITANFVLSLLTVRMIHS